MEFDSDYRPDDKTQQKHNPWDITTVLNYLFEPGLFRLKIAYRGSEDAQARLAQLEEWLQGASPAQIYHCANLYSIAGQLWAMSEETGSIHETLDSVSRQYASLLDSILSTLNKAFTSQQRDTNVLLQYIAEIDKTATTIGGTQTSQQRQVRKPVESIKSLKTFQELQMQAQDNLLDVQHQIAQMSDLMVRLQEKMAQATQTQSRMQEMHNKMQQIPCELEFIQMIYQGLTTQHARAVEKIAQVQKVQTESAVLLAQLQDQMTQMLKAQDDIMGLASDLLGVMQRNVQLYDQ